MASSPPLPPFLANTLAYFDKYDYPLTLDEIKYWSPVTHPRPSLNLREGSRRGELYFLPGRSHLVALRRQREKFSKPKWIIAKRVGEQLKKFPFIAAVFVTGALAMNNCPKNDDIDLMIITYPHTLWITRFFVNLYLWRLRRLPGQTSAPDKICLNLWLDLGYLRVVPWPAADGQGATLFDRRLYLAHEILQAKVLWDRADIHCQFLVSNSWARTFLPIAYSKIYPRVVPRPRAARRGATLFALFWPINLIFFLLQYLYMWPKKTSEKVSLHWAFFHPIKTE